ncbi:NAD(P)H-binding protein [Roseovarius atlanticus]|uniref:NAD(P)H-binding protein n=1 Tax=Roseovarius atlanticus TaxID=1641875 RepID=UPI0011873A3C|nr:NAD(P)H-binding protein [Roseovarius atlanticus]
MREDPAYISQTTGAPMRVVLLGASGTIGGAVLDVLLADGHEVICPLRRADASVPEQVQRVIGDLSAPDLLKDAMRGADAVVSCLASRSGAPGDAWAVDHGLNMTTLRAAEAQGVGRFVLLSAICVQKPVLAFQKAKLAFEAELRASDLCHVIVRPTAFFKSLSGQMDRIRAGKPYLAFGDGRMTACKPISDGDLARFMVNALTNPACDNRILPVGGPGPALTPEDQGRLLADSLGVPFRMKRVPVGLLDAIIATLSVTGRLNRRARAKAELARIGRYYATESMLVWDETRQRYDADATPEFGQDRLEEFYARLAAGEIALERGDHAVF